ncbi:MAG: SoxXA-binding protein [Gammaproteobacteria bacterium]|jgi:predicted small secreted protein
MRKTAIVCASLLTLSLLSACGSTGGSEDMAKAGGSSDIEQLIKEADAAIKKAASVDGEWRDSSGKYLKQAKAALSKGDLETAKKLAEKAKFEGEMGYQQAVGQKNAGPWLF